jgi:hypothetical protein
MNCGSAFAWETNGCTLTAVRLMVLVTLLQHLYIPCHRIGCDLLAACDDRQAVAFAAE